jgi:hypothetical protein
MAKITLLTVLGCAALMAADTFTQQQRQFWSFQKVQPKTPPAIKNVAWARNPVDRFILAKLETDVPVAGLLTDLKTQGLLDSTIAVWGGEFGRTSFNEKGNGRDHNPRGFSIWMAGGGIKKRHVIGRTDEIGLSAIERPVHVHGLHTTIPCCLGLDHAKVTYLHNGRSERPPIVSGDVIHGVLA